MRKRQKQCRNRKPIEAQAKEAGFLCLSVSKKEREDSDYISPDEEGGYHDSFGSQDVPTSLLSPRKKVATMTATEKKRYENQVVPGKVVNFFN